MSWLKRILILVVVIGATAAAAVVGQDALTSQAAADESADESPAESTTTETTAVTERDLTEEVELNGTLDHGETRRLNVEATGIVTAAPDAGDIVEPGDELVRVGDRPIVLAEGDVPLYRTLRLVSRWETDDAGDRLGKQTGADVTQLQNFLLDQGFDDEGRLEADGIFGISTERAVKAWQKDVGHPATGQIDGKQLLFLSGAIRIESAPEVGDQFSEIQVTGVTPVVTVSATNKQRSFFTVGTTVSVEGDDGTHTGEVTDLERTTGGDGSTQHTVTIEFPTGQAPGTETAKVTSTRIVADDAPSVPVRALIALAEGGWAVQVQTENGVQLTAVELGDIVDGIAAIDGVPVGTTVVIPA